MTALEDEIEARVKASGSSFYWGMRLLPRARRGAVFAVYAFCREVDDIADEGDLSKKERLRAFKAWRAELDRVFDGHAETTVGQALVGAVGAHDLRKADFLAVIDGCVMDVDQHVTRPSLAQLDLYCDRVASAVGRLSVRTFGPFVPACDDVAHHLGRALQLTNILRDVEEDADLGRLYLPDELLSSYGIKGDDPQAVAAHPALPLVRRDLGLLAKNHFALADRAMAQCPRTTMRPSRLMRATYGAIYDRLEAQGWRGGERVRLSKARKIGILLRHLA